MTLGNTGEEAENVPVQPFGDHHATLAQYPVAPSQPRPSQDIIKSFFDPLHGKGPCLRRAEQRRNPLDAEAILQPVLRQDAIEQLGAGPAERFLIETFQPEEFRRGCSADCLRLKEQGRIRSQMARL